MPNKKKKRKKTKFFKNFGVSHIPKASFGLIPLAALP